MARTPDSAGHGLAAADGGVFAFGDAGFFGSGAGALRAPAGFLLPTLDGAGHFIVTRSGTLDGSGDAANATRPPAPPSGLIVGGAALES